VLRIAAGTLRLRWAGLVGTVIALTLGVAMVAMMVLTLAGSAHSEDHGVGRYAEAPVVVRPTSTVGLPGVDRRRPLAENPGLSADLVTALRALGPVVLDRSFPVQAAGDGDLVGHAWSAAGFGSRRLLTGTRPGSDTEVVVDAPARVGDRIPVLTEAGPRTYTVAGTLAAGTERALFFTEAEAARLSPRVDALVSRADPEAVGAAARIAGSEVEVLTGSRRALAVPDPEREKLDEDVSNLRTVLGIATAVCGFVAIVVVSSSFAYSVGQRRREFALLRALGATPRQIRRMVTAEALLVGTAAASVGCLLGRSVTGVLVDLLIARGLAPTGFTSSDSPALVGLAFGSGLAVALLGVATAAWRAGRARPAAALRTAEATSRAGDVFRAVLGVILLVGGLAGMARVSLTDPAAALKDKDYTLLVIVLIGAVAVLAPLFLAPLTNLLTRPLARTSGAVGVLVRENSLAMSRRLAATATPVLITVGLAGCLLGGSSTAQQVPPAAARQRLVADYIVEPTGLPGLNREVLDRVAAVPGVTVTVTAPTTVYASVDGEVLDEHDATVVDPAALTTAFRLRTTAGSVRDLSDRSIVVDEEWQVRPGEQVQVRLADGRARSLTVAAVLRGSSGTFVTPALAGRAPADRILVTRAPSSDPATVIAALRTATAGRGAHVGPVEELGDAAAQAGREYRWWGMLVVLGIALVYSGIAIANTLATATLARRREIGLLRLAGAGRGQVLRMCAGESLLAVGLGTLLAAAVSAACLLGRWSALTQEAESISVRLPWATLGALIVVCAVTGVLAAIVPAWMLLRRFAAGGPVQLPQ
jgi:putative ABC transport system permease protein